MSCEINTNLELIKFNAVNLYLNKVVKPKPNTVINSRNKKLSVLRLERRQSLIFDTASIIKQTVHYYSSCNLSPEEEKAFSFSTSCFQKKKK